eukprot:scaffold11903_cov33-Prasinocladus_malaysianus.AAC.1
MACIAQPTLSSGGSDQTLQLYLWLSETRKWRSCFTWLWYRTTQADVAKNPLAAGIDSNTADNAEDWTALLWAAWMGHVEVMDVLLASSADVNGP